MSIASEIIRLQNDSSAIASAIAAKGITVPAGSSYDDYASLISNIPTGGSQGTANYLVYGNPTINGNIFIPDTTQLGFIYTNVPFSPGAGTSWRIQTRIKIHSFAAWKDIMATINPQTGNKAYSFASEFNDTNNNTQYSLYLSSNSSSWNLANNVCKGAIVNTNTWYTFQLVCNCSSSTRYTFYQGFPELESWTSTTSKSGPPIYGNYIGFGNNMIDAEFDLSATKIFVGNSVWWEAITI